QRGRAEVEIADREQVHAEASAERVAGPGTEDRREHRERETAAGIAPDRHVERRMEDPQEEREDRGRRDGHPATASVAGAESAAAPRPPAAGRMRPPPRHTSPSYSAHAWPGAAAHTGSSVSTVHVVRRVAAARGSGRTVASPSDAR